MDYRRICQLALTTSLSVRDIADDCGVAPNTVIKYRSTLLDQDLNWPRIDKMPLAQLEAILNPGRTRNRLQFSEPDWSYVHSEMGRAGVTVSLLYREYIEATPEAAMSEREFRRRYADYVKRLRISMRLPLAPGEQLFVDYSGKKPSITNPETGELIPVELWVGVLGASRKMFAHATMSQKLPDFLESHVLALEYFGAVPKILVPDNLKPAVTSVSWRDGHVINATYQSFAQHYGLIVLPTRPRRPKDKAAVENGVRLAQRYVLARLRNRVFYTLAELNAEVRRLMDEANSRPVRCRGNRSRSELFDQIDRPVMQPLPQERYAFAEWKVNLKVPKDYHLAFEGNWYSVPHVLIDARVDLRATREVVQMYRDSQLVATHPRQPGPDKVITNPDHQPPNHRAYAETNFGEMREWADNVGEPTRAFLDRHLERSTGAASINAFRGLNQLRRQFGTTRLNKACSRALLLGTISTNSLHTMLLRNLEDQPLAEEPVANPVGMHENVRGANHYADPNDTPSANGSDEEQAA